jgi:hypothetical protein
MTDIAIRPVATKADRKAFVELPFRLYADDPNWVPPLKDEVHALINPAKNPWFGHAEAQLFLAERGGRVVGRISAQVDQLALAQPPEQGMGPDTGNWGMMEAEDEAVFQALIACAELWLRERGMTRSLGPLSLSIWDEPGLLVSGFDHPPTVMMGHNSPAYADWVVRAGYAHAKSLYTYDVGIAEGFPSIVQRIVSSGEKQPRIVVRMVDKSRSSIRKRRLILSIHERCVVGQLGLRAAHQRRSRRCRREAENFGVRGFDSRRRGGRRTGGVHDGAARPERGAEAAGRLAVAVRLAKLLLWLRKPQVRTTARVPLMGVVKRLQSSRRGPASSLS